MFSFQKLLETVIEKIAHFTVEEEVFNSLKEDQHRDYYNTIVDPQELCW